MCFIEEYQRERCFVCCLSNLLHFMFKMKYLIIQLWIILIQIKFTKIISLCNIIFQYTCYFHFIMCFYSAESKGLIVFLKCPIKPK